jgi:hypothetical protein
VPVHDDDAAPGPAEHGGRCCTAQAGADDRDIGSQINPASIPSLGASGRIGVISTK